MRAALAALLLALIMADVHGQSPSFEDFRQAFIAGDVRQVDALLKASGNRPAVDEDLVTVLHKAIHIYSSSRDVVPVLLKAGADPLAKNDEGNVPLHRLAHDALLVAGVNVRNPAGLTPLHYAALYGNEGAIEWLLAKGADPELRTTAAYRFRASFMSKAFGPGDEVPVGSRPLDLAKMQHSHSRWSTGRHQKSVELLDKVTKRKGWFSR